MIEKFKTQDKVSMSPILLADTLIHLTLRVLDSRLDVIKIMPILGRHYITFFWLTDARMIPENLGTFPLL